MVLSGEYESRLAAPLPSDDDVNKATGSTSYLNDQHLVLAARFRLPVRAIEPHESKPSRRY